MDELAEEVVAELTMSLGRPLRGELCSWLQPVPCHGQLQSRDYLMEKVCPLVPLETSRTL